MFACVLDTYFVGNCFSLKKWFLDACSLKGKGGHYLWMLQLLGIVIWFIEFCLWVVFLGFARFIFWKVWIQWRVINLCWLLNYSTIWNSIWFSARNSWLHVQLINSFIWWCWRLRARYKMVHCVPFFGTWVSHFPFMGLWEHLVLFCLRWVYILT